MAFIIRIRDQAGMHRMMFKSNQSTWRDLSLQIQDVLKVKKDNQLLSRTAPDANPTFIRNVDLDATLEKLKVNEIDRY